MEAVAVFAVMAAFSEISSTVTTADATQPNRTRIAATVIELKKAMLNGRNRRDLSCGGVR